MGVGDAGDMGDVALLNTKGAMEGGGWVGMIFGPPSKKGGDGTMGVISWGDKESGITPLLKSPLLWRWSKSRVLLEGTLILPGSIKPNTILLQ